MPVEGDRIAATAAIFGSSSLTSDRDSILRLSVQFFGLGTTVFLVHESPTHLWLLLACRSAGEQCHIQHRFGKEADFQRRTVLPSVILRDSKCRRG